MPRDVFTFTAPAAWACALVNGDDSGLEESDAQAAQALAESLPGPIDDSQVEGDDSPRFLTWHDARPWCPLAAECALYVVLVERPRVAP